MDEGLPLTTYVPGTSVFELQTLLESLHADLQALALSSKTVGERSAVYAKILDTLKFAQSVIESLHSVQAIQSFMEEVLETLDSFEPGAQERILQALDKKRAL